MTRSQNDWTDSEDELIVESIEKVIDSGGTTTEALEFASRQVKRAYNSVRRRFVNHLVNTIDESIIIKLEKNNKSVERENSVVGKIENLINELNELVHSISVTKRENEMLHSYRQKYLQLESKHTILKKDYNKLKSEHENLKEKLKGLVE